MPMEMPIDFGLDFSPDFFLHRRRRAARTGDIWSFFRCELSFFKHTVLCAGGPSVDAALELAEAAKHYPARNVRGSSSSASRRAMQAIRRYAGIASGCAG